MRVVSHRVDALVLAYRVTLSPEVVAELARTAARAQKYGGADFVWHGAAVGTEGPVRPTERGRLGRDVMVVPPPWASREVIEGFGTDAPVVKLGVVQHAKGEATPIVAGAMRHSDRKGVYHLRCDAFRMMIKLRGDGAESHADPETGETIETPGFTVEIVWSAQCLAEWDLPRVLRESRAVAWMLGDVAPGGERLRRIDLCADVAGMTIEADDVDRIVKRPRALKDFARDASELDDLGYVACVEGCRCRRCFEKRELGVLAGPRSYETGKPGARKICGISVGRGGATMMRIYDKRLELAYVNTHVPDDACACRRCAEEKRWRAGGWDGKESVTRVEFQIRGEALSELGLRDPDNCFDVDEIMTETGNKRPRIRRVIVGHRPAVTGDGEVLRLSDRLPWLWATMLDWARLVVPDPDETTTTRLRDDPRWSLLRSVDWGAVHARPIRRFRARRAASEAQAIGVMLSQAAKAGELAEIVGATSSEVSPRLLSEDPAAYGSPEDIAERMQEIMARLFESGAKRAYAYLLARGRGDPVEGMIYFATKANAASARHFEWKGVVEIMTRIAREHAGRKVACICLSCRVMRATGERREREKTSTPQDAAIVC